MSTESTCHFCGNTLLGSSIIYRGFFSSQATFAFCSERCRAIWLLEWGVVYHKAKAQFAERQLMRLTRPYPQVVVNRGKLKVIPAKEAV